jgi:hypothetical protein
MRQQAEPQAKVDNVFNYTREQLQEMQAEEPERFAALIAQQTHRETLAAIQKQLQEEKQKAEVETRKQSEESAFRQFVKTNPDFVDLYEDGKIQDYLEENPGESYKSAYRALTEEKRIEAKVKAERDKWEADQKAKRGLRVSAPVGAQPSISNKDPRFSDTSKHGGPEDVMAQVLREMRAGP